MLILSALRGLGVLLEDECQAKCSKDYAENGGDIKLDLCEAGCGGEDATRDVLVGKLQDSINTLANREDKTEYNAAVLELNALCSDYNICSEWACFRDGVAKGNGSLPHPLLFSLSLSLSLSSSFELFRKSNVLMGSHC